MDFDAIYHFLFESFAGIGILIGVALVASLIYAIIAERKTRRVYKDRGERTDGFLMMTPQVIKIDQVIKIQRDKDTHS